MSTLKSNHNSSSEESLLNLEHNKKLVQDLKNKISEIRFVIGCYITRKKGYCITFVNHMR